MRVDGRGDRELRPLKITRKWTKYAEGSVLIEIGDTRVLCNASNSIIFLIMIGYANSFSVPNYIIIFVYAII